MKLDVVELRKIASEGKFTSYIAGTAAAIIESDQFRSIHSSFGIFIDNYLTTLPMKKGLSSSAAVCVLTVRCFDAVYGLGLTMEQVMELAYLGEMYTPSRCGRMDQCVAIGEGIGVMEFSGGSCSLRRLFCQSPLYFVVADLNSSKDTVVILRDLSSCFPFPQNPTQALMHEYVNGSFHIAQAAIGHIEQGHISALGDCMNSAQELFDRCAIPNCPSQLTSPVLHAMMDVLLGGVWAGLVLAVKGIGSQGDGSVQILCKDCDTQQKVLKYITEVCHLDGFTIIIPASEGSS